MEKILFVNACVRPESRTRALAELALSRMSGEVDIVNLETAQIAPLTGKTLEERTAALAQGDRTSPLLQYAVRFAVADRIVIAAPYWDLSFPALLKTYIEAVNVVGITFQYNENGVPETLCRAKALYYITTAGGPIFADLGFDYVKTVAEAFYQIPTVQCVRAEGLDVIGADVQGIMDAAKADILRMFPPKTQS